MLSGIRNEFIKRYNLSDTPSLGLNGALGIEIIYIGGRTFVYVAGQTDDAITAFELLYDGSLNSIETIIDDSNLELNGASHFASISIGTSKYLYVNSSNSDSITAFRVESDGSLTFVEQTVDDGTGALELNGTEGRMAIGTSAG